MSFSPLLAGKRTELIIARSVAKDFLTSDVYANVLLAFMSPLLWGEGV